MFQTYKAPRSLTTSSNANFSPYQNSRRARPANDCFRTTHDFLNPTDSTPVQKSNHRTDFRDHTDIINMSPVKRHYPTDELNLGLHPKGNNGSTTCRPRIREKDTSMDTFGELPQRDMASRRKQASNMSFQHTNRGQDLNIFDPSFHRTEVRDDDVSKLSVSRALKTIYEHCHESSKLLPMSTRSLSTNADQKGANVFNEVLSGLDAAGHTTYHKNFTSPREGKKRYANAQSIVSDQTGLSLAEEGSISRRKNVQQITKGNLGVDLVPGLKGIPEEKPFRLVSKQNEEEKQNGKGKAKKGRNNDEGSNRAQEDGLMSARGLGSDYSHQDSRYSSRRGDGKSKGLPLKKGFWSQINANYGLGKRLPLTGNASSSGVESRISLNSSRSQRLGP